MEMVWFNTEADRRFKFYEVRILMNRSRILGVISFIVALAGCTAIPPIDFTVQDVGITSD